MRKSFLFFLLVVFILSGCKKSVEIGHEDQQNTAVDQAKKFLQANITGDEFGMLDWTRAIFYKKQNKIEIISIPSRNSSDKKSAYVFLKENKLSGNWVSLEIGTNDLKYKKIVSQSFKSDRVGIVSLKENGFVNSIDVYENGILVTQIATRSSVLVYVPASVSGPNLTVLLLAQLLGVGSPDWTSGFLVDENNFEYLEPEPQGEGGGGYDIYVDILFNYDDKPSIDLQKFFNCFNNVPDNGATYTIKLCADLPVDGNPWPVVNVLTPGHAFLTVTKTNGSQSVTQSFGFYPISGIRSIFNSSCPSKFIDDGDHEFEASISMALSQSQFNTFKSVALNYTNNTDYDIDDFNCADFALNCFNSNRSGSDFLEIPDTYRTIVNYGTTPNGIYEKLKDMKDNNHPEAANIFVGKTNAPTSHGECN